MHKPMIYGVCALWLLAACAPQSTRPTATPAAALTEPASALVYDGIPALDQSVVERLRPYLEARTATFQGWLPEGQGVVISTRLGETQQLHTVASAEAMRRQITFYGEPVTRAVVSPDPLVGGLIFQRDEGGNEQFQLYFQRLDTGKVQRLTDGKSRNDNPVFARSGGRYAYASTARNGVDFDIWVGHVNDAEPSRIVHQAEGTWRPLDFSTDGRWLLVQEYVSILDNRLYIVDVEAGTARPLRPGQEGSANPMARFSYDGSGVYYLSDQGREKTGLHYLELATGRSVWLTSFLASEIVEFALGDRDQYIATLDKPANSHRLYLFMRGEPGTVLPRAFGDVTLVDGVISQLQFNEYGTDLGFVMSGAQIPSDVLSISMAGKQLTRWTRNETGGIDPMEMVMPRLEQVGSFDEGAFGLPRQIPGWVYRPTRAGKAPVVIMVHGGPEAQALPAFDPFIQFLVRELEVAVIAPNVRGSAGYGRTYLSLDDGVKRGDAVKDLEAWVDWARTQPDLDADRIVVYGGSYGGFMVLAAMTQFPDKIAGGVDIVGISNFISFLENTHPYRRDQRRQEYGDERDPAVRKVLEQVSPLNHVARISKPLFVIQGANDPRVPQSEADQIVRAVRARGGEVWYLLARNEGHGFRRKENLDAMRIAVVNWLQARFKSTQ